MLAEGLGQLDDLLGDARALNAVLKAFVQHLHNQGAPISWGSEALASVQCFAPHTRGQLGPAWLVQRQFARTRPLTMRPPIPIELLLSIVLVMWIQRQHRSAVATLLGFHCLLRPAELARLRRGD
eukprot:6489173-Amphidinium_carterae.1